MLGIHRSIGWLGAEKHLLFDSQTESYPEHDPREWKSNFR